MANWIQNCQICNDGLCIRMEELKKEGCSERQAAEVMQEEAYDSYPDLKEEFCASKIRNRYIYHMKKKRVVEFQPPDSQLAGWPMCKVCGSKLVVEKLHWHGSGNPLEPEEHGLCKSCYKDQLPKCKSCGTTLHGRKFSHGLCNICRKKEVHETGREDAQVRLDEREKEFNRTPVDTKAEEFWNDIINKLTAVVEGSNNDVPCAKVGERTLDNIKDFRHQLFNLVGCLDEVIEQSEVKVQ